MDARKIALAVSLLVPLAACGGKKGGPGPSEDAGGIVDAGSDAAVDAGPADDAGGHEDAGNAVPCSSEDDCTGATAHCDSAKGICVGCAGDDDCRGKTLCDTKTGICRDCVTNDDCGGGAPICDAVSGQCTDVCDTNADCVATGGPHTCDTDRHVCVDCIGPNDPCRFCELVTFSCVGCLVDGDCPPGDPFCGPSYECTGSCATDDDCPSDLFCDLASERCVECAKNAHCPGEVCQRDYTCG